MYRQGRHEGGLGSAVRPEQQSESIEAAGLLLTELGSIDPPAQRGKRRSESCCPPEHTHHHHPHLTWFSCPILLPVFKFKCRSRNSLMRLKTQSGSGGYQQYKVTVGYSTKRYI